MISSGKSSISRNDIAYIPQLSLISHYLGIEKIPCIINSPLRKDNHPSFGIYSPNGIDVNYRDFSTGESGSVYTLLKNLWCVDYTEVYKRIHKDFKNLSKKAIIRKTKRVYVGTNSNVEIKCKVRQWKDYDIAYWESYGITLPWLKYANVYPISHKIIIKDSNSYVFGADKYAYAFVEFKEGKTSIKIYQPYNNRGFKWATSTDRSVISLWTKVPKYGDKICICSSLKDSLCLWSNCGIPAICPQGEGYGMSDTAVNELKRRFKKVYILYDNDDTGLIDGRKLAESTGFVNVVLPRINDCKDISDLYKSLNNKQSFKNIISNLFI